MFIGTWLCVRVYVYWDVAMRACVCLLGCGYACVCMFIGTWLCVRVYVYWDVAMRACVCLLGRGYACVCMFIGMWLCVRVYVYWDVAMRACVCLSVCMFVYVHSVVHIPVLVYFVQDTDGIMTMQDIYCRFNRARGMEVSLVSRLSAVTCMPLLFSWFLNFRLLTCRGT